MYSGLTRSATLLCLLVAALLVLPLSRPRRAIADAGFIPAANRIDAVHDHTRNVIYISNGNQVLRFDVPTNSFLSPITGFGAGSVLYGLDLSPDDRWLVVADRTYGETTAGVWSVDLTTGVVQPLLYPREGSEGGTHAVAFGSDGNALFTCTYLGSGSVKLRRCDPRTGQVTQVASTTQDSMVSASADGSVIGIAEGNISSGPVGRYRVTDGNLLRRTGTGWYNFEIGVNRNGTQYAVPTYGGTFVYDANHNRVGGLIGQYGAGQPVGVVYHPTQDIVYFPWAGTRLVHAYDTNTFAYLGAYDFAHTFRHTGNWAFTQGRMRISRDGSLLIATVDGGVRFVQLGDRRPVAHSQTIHLLEDSPFIPVKLTGSSTTGALNYEVVAAPNSGSLQGSVPDLEYMPAPEVFGTETLQFRVLDASGASSTAAVTLVIAPVNDAPSFVKGQDLTVENTAGAQVIPTWATQIKAGPGNEATQVLTFRISNDNPALFASQPVIDANGRLDFTPAQGQSGTANLTVRLEDNGGTANGGVNVSPPQTFTITVTAQNLPPKANLDSATTSEDVKVLIDVLANDTDPNGDPLTITVVSQPSIGSAKIVSNKIEYSPAVNFNGSASFVYFISDGRGGTSSTTVSLTVTPVNDPPVAIGEARATDEDRAVPASLIGRDVEQNPLTYSIVRQPAHGTLSGTVPGLTYTPNPNFNGQDSFDFIVSDGQHDSNVATVRITVRAVNDPPTAVTATATTAEDTSLLLDVLANVSDVDGDALTLVSALGGQFSRVRIVNGKVEYLPFPNFHGQDACFYTVRDPSGATVTGRVDVTVTPVPDPPSAFNQTFTQEEDRAATFTLGAADPDKDPLTYTLLTQPAKGSLTGTAPNLTFTPHPNFSGTDTFTFKVNDGTTDSNVATITLNVLPVNDAPVAAPDSYVTNEDVPLTLAAPAVLANDTDVEGDPLTAVQVDAPSHGTLALNPDGSFTYTPAANYHGSDSFTYKAGDGSAESAVTTVTLTVRPVDDAPTARNDAFATDEDQPLIVPAPGLLGNDTDPDGDPLTAVQVTEPIYGTLTANADGSFTYTPRANFYGDDLFTYRASGGGGVSAPTPVIISIRPVNDAPSAGSDSAVTPEDTAVGIPVLGNDADPDGDTLTLLSVTPGQHGAVQIDNNRIIYTPSANFHGTDTFSYTVGDGAGATAAATVTVTVSPVNDPPVGAPQNVTTNEDTARSLTLTGSDPEGAQVTFAVVSGPGHGTLTGTAPNLTYRPAANYHGPDSFTYKVSDGQVESAPITISISVLPVNDAPTAVADSAATTKNTAVTINVLGNDRDPDGDALTVTTVTTPRNGSVVRNADGSVRYAPKKGFTGTDTFSYTLRDPAGLTSTATVTVTVRK